MAQKLNAFVVKAKKDGWDRLKSRCTRTSQSKLDESVCVVETPLSKSEVQGIEGVLEVYEDVKTALNNLAFARLSENLGLNIEQSGQGKVFLGGTCNNDAWRDELIPWLNIRYFNPVVDDWTPECQKKEIEERENADFVLYVITSAMKGVYSIAEAVDDSNKRPEKTFFTVITAGFDDAQVKSLKAVADMVERNGGTVVVSESRKEALLHTAFHLNGRGDVFKASGL